VASTHGKIAIPYGACSFPYGTIPFPIGRVGPTGAGWVQCPCTLHAARGPPPPDHPPTLLVARQPGREAIGRLQQARPGEPVARQVHINLNLEPKLH
jgi:hypothetical protein